MSTILGIGGRDFGSEGGAALPCYAGLDCSKRSTSICVLGPDGETLREGVVESSPAAIIEALRNERRRYVRVGLESWTMAPLLYEEFLRAKLPPICIDALHAHGFLRTRRNKTDKNDARGIAEMMRAGIYRAVHVKSASIRQLRGLFTVRRTLVRKRRDVENSIGGLLLQFGAKMPTVRGGAFEREALGLGEADAVLGDLIDPLVRLRRAIVEEISSLEQRLKRMAREDQICKRLMTAPGVGPMTALAYRLAVDDPARFRRSRDVAPHLGLTPRIRRSGDIEHRGRTSRMGDSEARQHLFLAAQVILRRGGHPSWLRAWGEGIASRRGRLKAIVAVARRLAVVLHRMWVDDADFRWEAGPKEAIALATAS